MTPRVWTYWEGPKPPWIEICLQSMNRNVPDIEILTPDTWKQVAGGEAAALIEGQAPNVKSDFIRAWLLHHIGGIWIDADAIVFRDLRPLWERAIRWDFVAYRVGPPKPQICTALIASRPNSDIGNRYLGAMTDKLRTGKRLSRLALGPRVLAQAVRASTRRLYAIPTWRVHQVHWMRKGNLQLTGESAEIAAAAIRSEAYCCMLTHRALGPLRQKTAKELTDGDWMVSRLYRRALRGEQ